MTRAILTWAMAGMLAAAVPARAQLSGIEVEGGVSAFSRTGTVSGDRTDYSTTTGWRGLARLGIGPLSGGLEMSSLLDEGGGGMHRRYAGAFVAFHPLAVFGLVPYVDVGAGRVHDARLEGAARDADAWTYGAGAEFHVARHWGVNAGAHAVRGGRPQVDEVKTSGVPTTVSMLVAYRF